MWARPAISPAGTSARDWRRRSRAGPGSPPGPRSRSAARRAARPRWPPLRARERRRDRRDRVRELGGRRPDPAARLAAAVAHPLAPEAEAELPGQRLDLGVAREDELGAHLDHGAVGELARPDPPADAIARLQHLDLPARGGAGRRRGEAREAGPDHDRARARARAQRSTRAHPLRLLAAKTEPLFRKIHTGGTQQRPGAKVVLVRRRGRGRPGRFRARRRGRPRSARGRGRRRRPDRGSAPAARTHRPAPPPGPRAPRRRAGS